MITRDVLALRDEQSGGTPLLGPVMRAGHRLLPTVSLAEARGYAERQRGTLAPELRAIERAAVAFPIEVSPQLGAEHARVTGLMR